MKKILVILCITLFGLYGYRRIATSLPTQYTSLFSGSGNCVTCHAGEGNVLINSKGRDVSPLYHWQSSMMGNSAIDPYWQAKVSSESEENPHIKAIIEDKCATCHAPMGRTEAIKGGQESYSLSEVQNSDISMDGVSCTLCHQIDMDNLGRSESFSGHYEILAGKKIYGPYPSPFTNSMINNTGFTPVYGSHIESSQLCATCHTLITPFVDQDGNIAGEFPEQMPYFEWLNSQYPEKEETCQTCHMPRVHEDFTIASLPPNLSNKRNPVFEHHFVGGNTTVNRILKENYSNLKVKSALPNLDTTANYAIKNLKENTIELNSTYQVIENQIAINVELTNKTGHKLPTGFPSRRLWIHFTVRNASNQIIFESGNYNSMGEIAIASPFETHHDTINSANQVQIYEAVMGNTQNTPTTILLEAAQYLKDNRLPPIGFTSTQSYDSLIAITGKAANDDNFNRASGIEGSGKDIITYIIPNSGEEISYNIEVCYQSIKPTFVNHLKTSKTNESNSFTTKYDSESIPKVQIIAELSEQKIANNSSKPMDNWGIYPNPTNDRVQIKGNFQWPIQFKLYDIKGNVKKSGTLHSSLLSFGELAKGSYLLQISDEGKSKTFPVIFQ